MILIKFIILQSFWFLNVLYGKNINPSLIIALSLILVLIDFFITKPKISPIHYLTMLLFCFFSGVINDIFLLKFGLIDAHFYNLGFISLWIIFISYYEPFFEKFRDLASFKLAIIGGVGGAMSYISAMRLGALMVNVDQKNTFVIFETLYWAAFFPLSIKAYFNQNIFDNFLDKTVFFSFDRTGFLRHKKKFNEDLVKIKIQNKSALVTGATAGIGQEVARGLHSSGASVTITGRDASKAAPFIKECDGVKFIALDMSNWSEVYQFAKVVEPLDYIVFNAGGMPDHLSSNEQGVEFQCASQLLGHYFLFYWLHENKKINRGARIVWVSSGGMYLKKLDLQNLFRQTDYDKVATYANVKRAQVTLVEELAKMTEFSDYSITVMHPGWVKTAGVKDALPGFFTFMNDRLRLPPEGADTILWILLTSDKIDSGGFYFDRKKVSPYIAKSFIPGQQDRKALLDEIKKFQPF